MKIFLVLIIIFILLILLSLLPLLTTIFSYIFDSSQFKAIRLITTIFGILGVIFGLLNWYTRKNPKVITKETSFQLDILSSPLPTPLNKTKEESALDNALNDLIWNPFVMCFMQGWKPVLTEIDNLYNLIVKSFKEDKGELITKQKIDSELSPSKSTANITEFYIPPKATFNITRKGIKGRLWGYITIKNNYVELSLEITTLDGICYVKTSYLKEGFWNYVFYNYYEYDRWFEIIKKKILLKQEINKKISEHLKTTEKMK